jgi:hypothetical protein
VSCCGGDGAGEGRTRGCRPGAAPADAANRCKDSRGHRGQHAALPAPSKASARLSHHLLNRMTAGGPRGVASEQGLNKDCNAAGGTQRRGRHARLHLISTLPSISLQKCRPCTHSSRRCSRYVSCLAELRQGYCLPPLCRGRMARAAAAGRRSWEADPSGIAVSQAHGPSQHLNRRYSL